jgi:hypothetical protein
MTRHSIKMKQRCNTTRVVMPALVAGTHALLAAPKKDVGGRDKPGHDDREIVSIT